MLFRYLGICNPSYQIYMIHGANATVMEIYKIDVESDQLVVNEIGIYDPIVGFQLDEPSIWLRRSNLQGLQFRVGYHTNNYAMFILNPDGSYGGYLGQIVTELQASLNFTSKLIPVPGNGYGILVDETNFDGVIGMLQRREVDIGMAELSITQERLKAIDFMEPCWATNFK